MKFLKIQEENHVAYVSINRPPANALASELIEDVAAMLDLVEQNEDVRVIVLYGEGRFFSAGADIKEFTTIKTSDDFSTLSKRGQEVFERIECFSKPVIAAIHGAALGGGLELAMACHLRYVTETAKLGLPELQLGLVPGFAGSQRLTRYVGPAKAAEMMFTSDPITGEEAVKWGLANQDFPEEALLDSVKKIASKIAMKGPIALEAAIKLINYSKHEQFYQGVEEEAVQFGKVFSTEDAKEGIVAFIEKRMPIFEGK